jgi:hypothetical protein
VRSPLIDANVLDRRRLRHGPRARHGLACADLAVVMA